MIKLEVIGDPIEHSLSPKVHGAALDAIGVEFEYAKVRVKGGELKDYLSHVKRDKVDGFNLTMPHKKDIIEYLSSVSEEARKINAVNTVCVRDDKLLGYNTDGIGFELSLNRNGYEFSRSRVVIIGAGGVAGTLAAQACASGAKSVRILNRTAEKADEICEMVKNNFPSGDIKAAEIKELCDKCENADIFINATPLGMRGVEKDFEDLSFLERLPANALVADLIYNPAETSLMKRGADLGLKTQNGLGMLIFQALAADEYYLEEKLDMQKMYEKVEKALNF